MTAGGIGGPDRPLEVVSAERRGAELPGHFKQQWISAVFLEHGVGERDGGGRQGARDFLESGRTYGAKGPGAGINEISHES